MTPRRFAAGLRRMALLLAFAAHAGCAGDSCTSKCDCSGGEICAGPQQGPFKCYKDCSHATCPGDKTCAEVTAAEGAAAMACLPTTP